MTESPAGRVGFRCWLAGATLSTLGDSITFFALAWVAASHGPGVASLVLTLEAVPLALLILVGGAVADRWGIRRVMIACDAFMVLVMGLFAVGALVAVPVWALAEVAVLSGTAAALRRPSASVFPRMFAGGDELSRTMATATLFQQLAQIAGASVGGVLLAVGGLALTSGLDAVSFLVVLVVLSAVRPPREPATGPATGESLAQQLREALVVAGRTPGVRATVLTVVGMAATILPLVSLCVPLAGHDRGWGPGGTGLVSGAWVVGGLLVMAVVSRCGAPGRRTSLAGPVTAAAGAVLLAATDSLAAGAAAVALVGVGTSLLTTRLFPRFVEATPPAMLARFSSLLGLAQTGPVLLVTPVLGRLIHVWGVAVALGALAGVLMLTLLAALRAEQQLSQSLPEPRDAVSPATALAVCAVEAGAVRPAVGTTRSG